MVLIASLMDAASNYFLSDALGLTVLLFQEYIDDIPDLLKKTLRILVVKRMTPMMVLMTLFINALQNYWIIPKIGPEDPLKSVQKQFSQNAYFCLICRENDVS